MLCSHTAPRNDWFNAVREANREQNWLRSQIDSMQKLNRGIDVKRRP